MVFIYRIQVIYLIYFRGRCLIESWYLKSPVYLRGSSSEKKYRAI